MNDETKSNTYSSVDKSLVAMFLKMTPEERLQMNENLARTILELRNGFKDRHLNNLPIC